MSTANKLTYLNTTKQKLKQAINNLGGSIDEQTTFREYANQLQNVYDNLPKTDYAEGTEVNLGKTIKGKLDYDNGVVGIGQTEQDGTPTPSTPITINSVTGNQDVVVSGKNLSTINSISTTGGGYINYSVSQLANVTKGETYTLSIKNNTSSTSNLNVRITSGGTYSTETQGNLVANGTKSYTFTASRSGILNLNSKLGTEDVTNALTEIQLEKGSTATTYEPYITPTSYQLSLGDIELNAIGDYKDYIWTDRSTGKWYKHSAIGKYQFTGDENVINQSSNARFIIENIVEFIKIVNTRLPVYCNRFQFLESGSSYYGMFLFYGSNAYQVYIYNRDCTTTAELKTFLENNNTYFYYPLNNPTDTEITDTTLITQLEAWYNAHSLNGTTIITSNGDLPMIIKVRGLKGE